MLPVIVVCEIGCPSDEFGGVGSDGAMVSVFGLLSLTFDVSTL